MTNYLDYDKNMQMLSNAIKYCEEKKLHEDIINELYNENDLKKQIYIIELDYIKNQNDADVLVSNLTGHSGPIRESSAYKILEFIQNDNFCKFFQTENILYSFVKALVDINPSVSRNTVEIIKYAESKQYVYNKLIKEINTILEVTDINKKNRSYEGNKKNFGLYWNLEGVISLKKGATPGSELIEILEKTKKSNDYTIREKTAKCAKVYGLTDILEELKGDENIYVRKYCQSKLCQKSQ